MPSKDFTLDDGLAVTIYKRKTNRYLRLSVSPIGKVRVSIPWWAPYRDGLNFARARQDWIRSQRQPAVTLRSGQAVGKSHHLTFVAKSGLTKPSGRVQATEVVISHPEVSLPVDVQVQKVARDACIRALRLQAEQLLPQRLASLAADHGFSYSEVRIKHLKSRWGSCDQQGRIVLNLFLMQLPWDVIDYVLLHELTHTRILRHGPDFWRALGEVSPEAGALKKRLRNHQPLLAVG